jgi:hypothetical protein
MNNLYSLEEHKKKRSEARIDKRPASTFPNAGTVEDNLKPVGRVYKFNAECYRDTDKAILIWHDIWLPNSQIKIVWGERQVDYVDVKLSVPKWLVKKTLLDDYLKVD